MFCHRAPISVSTSSTINLVADIDKLNFIYGSLPRPQDLRSTVVCMGFMTFLPKKLGSRSLEFREYIDGIVAYWHNLEARYAHREGELRLDNFKQIREYGIDNIWLEVLLEYHVFTFRTHGLKLLSRKCNEDSLILNY